VNLDDAQIMKRVQGGQLPLFDELVLRYQESLIRVARSKLGEAAWAEDVVQEAFLAAFAARATYDCRFSFRTWLWTILLNLCRRQLKQQSRRPRPVSDPAMNSAAIAGVVERANHETGLSLLLASEQTQLLTQYLNELPEAQADALRLRFFGELKFDEIARTMNCSLNGAKMRVRNGLLKLAHLIRVREGDTQ